MRTVLIGLDGATFSILDPLMEEGVMPFLRRLVARGTRAELLSTPNPLTPPAWTSLATGRTPGNHGIFDFLKPYETEEGIFLKLLSSRDVQCDTLWTLASRYGKRVILLNFPLTNPPPAISGFVVPGFVSYRHLRRATYPPGFYQRLQALLGLNTRDLALDLDYEKKGIQGLPPTEYAEWIRFHIRRESLWGTLLRHLMTQEAWDLAAVVFDGPDKLQHLAWRFLDPQCFPAQPSPWEQEIRTLCLEYFRQLDALLATLCALAGPEARIFVASDHGFGPTWDIFYLNVWLQQHGYLAWGAAGAPCDEEEGLLAMRMRTQYELFDWQHTVAYALTPSSNGVYIRVAQRPGQAGIAPEAYAAFRQRLIAELLAFTDPASGEPVVKRVLTREEAFAGRYMHEAPDLTLVLRDHGFISILNADAPLKRRREPKGMHRPEGILIAAGPGIPQGAVVPPLAIVDLFPALLYSLDLAIPADIDAQFPQALFEPAWLRAAPPRVSDAALPLSSSPEASTVLSDEEEAAMVARLKALGYLE
ncbi:MAG: nucleotide pyrophosphatase [Candidatus Tectimicrobiota bacterium]|nr:MAG: nucleotide pyrophosphatase [Candidatus Tectomicrobia bacterium]